MTKYTQHPKALWWLSIIYALFSISYGVLFANLLLYSDQGGPIHFGENYAFAFFASFVTLTFILPLAGGYLADKCGFIPVALLGFLTTFIGLICLSLPALEDFYIGTALCITGNALAMPSVWAMVGFIYKKQPQMREAGVTLFYLIFNTGFLFTFSASSFVATDINFHVMFLIFSAGAFLAFFLLLYAKNKIQHLPAARRSYSKLILGFGITFFGTLFLLHFLILNNLFMWLIMLGILLYLIKLIRNCDDVVKRNHIKAFTFLCFLAVIAITIYNSEFGLMPEFAKHAVNLTIINHMFPAQSITSLDPLFCIILGLAFSKLWRHLELKKQNPGLATKFSLGIMLPALGYLLLALLMYCYLQSRLPGFWLLVVFLLFVSGELMILPIGIAMANRLAPREKEGLFMGIWNVMQGFSGLLTGYLAYFTVVNMQQTQMEINWQYFQVFFYTGIVIICIGAVVFLVRKKINDLTNG